MSGHIIKHIDGVPVYGTQQEPLICEVVDWGIVQVHPEEPRLIYIDIVKDGVDALLMTSRGMAEELATRVRWKPGRYEIFFDNTPPLPTYWKALVNERLYIRRRRGR
jgi:hypothetical protein